MFWSFIDNFANLGIQFVVGVILARILDPREFGLIGMLTIFIAISQVFIDSGFSNALIRKTNCTQSDYSTVFFFNLAVSIILYIILFFAAERIAHFFEEPQLKILLQVLGIGLIINALAIIQRTILTKNINFKLQTKVSLVAAIGSGIIAITMALIGYGVWSLIALTLSRYLLTTLFLWIWQKWVPFWIFSKKSFTDLFGFGSKLLASGLIDTAYRNIYYLVIGKYFTAVELGYYTRADQFQTIPSSGLNAVISRVTYPVLANMQHDKQRLKTNYQKIIRTTMYITFILMIGMAAIAKPMILTLVGEKWLPTVIYLQMLCFVGMLYPLHALNLNMLNVLGRSDLFLKLEILKKALAIPVIILGIFWGIKMMILGMIFNSLIAYYLNSYWSGMLIDYSIKQQVEDVLPSFLLAVAIGSIMFILNYLTPISPLVLLSLQIIIGGILTILLGELLKFHDYIILKKIIIEKYQTFKRNKNG